MAAGKRDSNTLSNYDQYTTVHTRASLAVDFENQILNGEVILKLEAAQQSTESHIILDTSFLNVEDVKADGKPCEWELLARSEPLGSPLRINLQTPIAKQKSIIITLVRLQLSNVLFYLVELSFYNLDQVADDASMYCIRMDDASAG